MDIKRIILSATIGLSIISSALPAFAQANCDASVNYSTLSTQQYNNGEYAASINSFTCLAVQRPDNAGVLNNRGNAQRELGNWQAAIDDYTLAIEIDNQYAVAYNNRGWAYFNLEQNDLAIADYTSAINIDPDMAYAYNNRGLIYQLRGDNELAIADFQRAIELNAAPTAWAEYNLSLFPVGSLMSDALSSYNNRSFEASIDLFSQVIELDPNNDTAFYFRGRSYITMDRFEEAAADFDRLVELRPDFEYAYWERAIAYAELGDFEQATDDAQIARQLNPSHVNNYIVSGTLSVLSGDMESAGDQFQRLMNAWEVNTVESDALEAGDSMSVEMYQGWIYSIPFEGEEGQVITLQATSTEADAVIVVLDADGNAIAGDDDSGVSLDALISGFTLPADGTYTLLVSHAGGGSNGTVEVTLESF